MSNHLIFFYLILSCSWAFAQEQESLEKLSAHPHWLKLLHYSKPLLKSPHSDIISKDFFLDRDGSEDPLKELQATINGLRSSQDTYCKFPSRRLWLEKQGYDFPARTCPDFSEWTRGNSIKSISLIFASGFLGNPASFFGHPLLKFNFKDQRSPHDFLDTAINYGAFTPPDVDPFAYAIFGIFGGYEAGFTSADFFFHANNYSELELRDMWEYELKLSEDQVAELVAHVWDLKGAKINYYFFSDNCAYRMGDLLELVTGKEFVSENSIYAIPSSLFHRISEYSLASEVKLLRSRQTRMRDKVTSLSKNQKKLLAKIVDDPSYLKTNDFNEAQVDSKSKVLEAGLDYYSYRLATDDKNENYKETRRQLLRKRVSLPPKEYHWKESKLTPPHQAQRPVLTQFGFVQSDKFGRTGTFRFRPVYYDLVSPDAGRPPLSSLAAFDFEVNVNSDRVWLRYLNLLSIENLNLSKTQLPGDGGFAWRIKAGADQVNLACNTCAVPRIEMGGGKAFALNDSLVIYAMIDPRFQSHLDHYGFLSVTPSLSALITFSRDFRVSASAGKRYQIDEGNVHENIFNVEGRVGSSRFWDMRITYQEHIDRRYGLAGSYYW